jgi:transposase-like protein
LVQGLQREFLNKRVYRRKLKEDGTKRKPGLRLGATENAAVCAPLLEDLQARDLDTKQPTLLVPDGSKALDSAATRGSLTTLVIQRCQVHEWPNIKAHLAENYHAELVRQLATVYQGKSRNQTRSALVPSAR